MKYVALLKELKSFLRENNFEESIAHIIIEDFLGKNYHIYLDDEDVSEAIRSIDVTNNVSAVSSYEGVREEMVNLQKEYGKKGGIVMDGRDIGTTVFPNAELKIFQIASVEERANRRYKENMRKGIACDLNTLKEEIKVRDFKDSTRSVSPLRKASDAIELDTSNLEPKEVVDKIIELARKIIESEE
jgi:cytidylate kinase